MDLLTGKQRQLFKGFSHNNIQPIFQVGKAGVTDNIIKQFSDALEARELVKATVLKMQYQKQGIYVKKLPGLQKQK